MKVDQLFLTELEKLPENHRVFYMMGHAEHAKEKGPIGMGLEGIFPLYL